MKELRQILLPTLLLVFTTLTAYAQTPERQGLRGALVLRVLIEPLDSEAAAGSLNNSQLRADVELRLRKAGIRVIDDNESTMASPYLYVNLNVIDSQICNFRAYSIKLEFNRLVTVFGKDKNLTFANVWDKGYLGVQSNPSYPTAARDAIGGLIDIFINDYLAENPKP